MIVIVSVPNGRALCGNDFRHQCAVLPFVRLACGCAASTMHGRKTKVFRLYNLSSSSLAVSSSSEVASVKRNRIRHTAGAASVQFSSTQQRSNKFAPHALGCAQRHKRHVTPDAKLPTITRQGNAICWRTSTRRLSTSCPYRTHPLSSRRHATCRAV